MTSAQTYSGQDRRGHNRSDGPRLRRRQNLLPENAADKRRSRHSGFDIAAALEMYLDQITTRRGMIRLLQSWLHETASETGRDEDYVRAVERAIEVMTSESDPLTAIAMLQRSTR